MSFIDKNLTHSEFITSLKNLGFDIRVIGNNDCNHTFDLKLNAIRIPIEDYPIFGYYCGGAYASCNRSKKNDFPLEDLEIAMKKCSEILMNEIFQISKIPSYFDCRDYLNSYEGNKVEKSSINRVLNILKTNYQELVRSVIGFKNYQ